AWALKPVPLPNVLPISRFRIALPQNFSYIGAQDPNVAVSPDGKHIVYVASRTGNPPQLRTSIRCTGSDSVIRYGKLVCPFFFAGRPVDWLLFRRQAKENLSPWRHRIDALQHSRRHLRWKLGSRPKTGTDLWVMSLDGDRKPRVFLQTPFAESSALISPDGHW